MSYDFVCNRLLYWSMGKDLSLLFLTQLKSFEELFEKESGLGLSKEMPEFVYLDINKLQQFLEHVGSHHLMSHRAFVLMAQGILTLLLATLDNFSKLTLGIEELYNPKWIDNSKEFASKNMRIEEF